MRRNRIFFFGSYDAYRYRVATDAVFVTIPTLKERAGDFSELPVAIYDPQTTSCPGGTNCTRQPFAGKIIPANRISRASKFFPEPMPAPTHSGIAGNFLNNNKGVGFNNANVNVKVDLNASDDHPFRCCSPGAPTTRAAPSAATRFRFRCPTS